MNCVETPAVCPAPPSLEGGRPLRLAFVGGLHLNRWRAMEDIGKALLVLREEGRATELIVYISTADRASYGEALSAIPTIRLCPSLSSDELMPTLQAADILVHLDSFDPGPRQFLRLSMSTKLPTYMSCGRPILAYGPREVGSCRYIETCGCGVVVGERDVGALVTALRPLAGNPQERARLGARGWQVASEQHRGDKVRQRFRSVLARAASGGQTAARLAHV
jgi:glycosyltransferase involved in cell wall biosynthesis